MWVILSMAADIFLGSLSLIGVGFDLKIFLWYISNMYFHALFEFKHPCHHLTHRPSMLCVNGHGPQWTSSNLIQT